MAGRPSLSRRQVAGLLFYKPQLGATPGRDYGHRSRLGSGSRAWRHRVTLLLITLFTLPGTLGDYLHRLPANVHFVQETFLICGNGT